MIDRKEKASLASWRLSTFNIQCHSILTFLGWPATLWSYLVIYIWSCKFVSYSTKLIPSFCCYLYCVIIFDFYWAQLFIDYGIAPCFYIMSYEAGNMAAGNMAGTYYEQGQMDMAIVHYKQAIECDSGFLEAYNNLVGSCLCWTFKLSYYNFQLWVSTDLRLFWFVLLLKGQCIERCGENRWSNPMLSCRLIMSILFIIIVIIFLKKILHWSFFFPWLYEAMPGFTTKPSTGTYQSWKYIYGMVCSILISWLFGLIWSHDIKWDLHVAFLIM